MPNYGGGDLSVGEPYLRYHSFLGFPNFNGLLTIKKRILLEQLALSWSLCKEFNLGIIFLLDMCV